MIQNAGSERAIPLIVHPFAEPLYRSDADCRVPFLQHLHIFPEMPRRWLTNIESSTDELSSVTVLETTIPVRKSRRRIAGSLPGDYADDGFQRSYYSRDL